MGLYALLSGTGTCTCQCCGSGMFIPDPGSWFLPIPDPGSRIPDPKTATKDRVEKIFLVKPFFFATNFTKLNIILFLICWRKKFGPIFQELLKFLPKNLSPSPQKYGFGIRDSGFGIRKKHIPDPGSRGQKGTGSRIRIRNTGTCLVMHIPVPTFSEIVTGTTHHLSKTGFLL